MHVRHHSVFEMYIREHWHPIIEAGAPSTQGCAGCIQLSYRGVDAPGNLMDGVLPFSA